MKKLFSVLLATLLLFSYAYAEEISFQNIPWMSDDVTALQMLKDAGLYRGIVDVLSLSNDGAIIINENEMLEYQPNTVSEFKNFCFTASLKENIKGKIAGAPIENIILTFAYDGQYKLIAVKVDLLNSDYEMMKTKLTKVYGEGETKNIEDEGIETIIWKGENNTGVLLYTESEGMKYQLYYGRLDAAEILENCLNTSDPDDVSGL